MGQREINISYKKENHVLIYFKIIAGKINFAPSFLSLHPYISDRYYKFVKDNFMKPLCLCLCLFIGLFWKQMRPQKPLWRLYKPSLDLLESLLLRKTISVQWLGLEILRYRQKKLTTLYNRIAKTGIPMMTKLSNRYQNVRTSI